MCLRISRIYSGECQHNHHLEFVPAGGRLPYDILLEECDPGLVKMEMDLCWIIVGGQDPPTYFKRYPGRFPLVHAKDLKKIPVRGASDTGAIAFEKFIPLITDVGSGVIDWKRIFAESEKAGIKHYFVEHDEPASPFDSIKASYRYLRGLRF